jgi:hypothetical protein
VWGETKLPHKPEEKRRRKDKASKQASEDEKMKRGLPASRTVKTLTVFLLTTRKRETSPLSTMATTSRNVVSSPIASLIRRSSAPLDKMVRWWDDGTQSE